jgi:phospholipase A-2-activating protein
MQKKIEQLNQKLISEGRKDLSLNPTELAVLKNVLKDLKSSGTTQSSQAVSEGLSLAIKLMTAWPYSDRLPGLDLLRLLAVAPRTATYTHPRGGNIINILEASITEQKPPAENNLMMAIRAFANLFGSEEGRTLAFAEFDKILSIADTPSSRDTRNRNLLLAVTTLYINYAVFLSSSGGQRDASSFKHALNLLDTLSKIINSQNDPEVIYRTLIATGTLLGLSNGIRTIAKGIYSIEKTITIAIGKAADARIRNVAGEIMASLR